MGGGGGGRPGEGVEGDWEGETRRGIGVGGRDGKNGNESSPQARSYTNTTQVRI